MIELPKVRMPGWMDSALCAQADPETFFPPRVGALANVEAKRICNRCPVQTECLRYAVERPDLAGIWGGTSERQRKDLRRGAKDR